jgi:hypothetical protein
MESAVFGSLTWNSFMWSGEVKLASLAGCYRRWVLGHENRDERDEKEKRGIFALNVFAPRGTTPGSRDEPPHGPGQEQIAAYRYLLDNEAKLIEAVMTGILQHFREDWFEDWQRDWEDKRLVERINTVAGIRETVSFIGLFVHGVAKDGQSYLGFDFGCDWHPHLSEHNLGVLMHRDRVVEVGQAETAFDYPREG